MALARGTVFRRGLSKERILAADKRVEGLEEVVEIGVVRACDSCWAWGRGGVID